MGNGVTLGLRRWFGLPDRVRDRVLAALLTITAQIELTFGSVAGSLLQQRLSFVAITAAIAWRRSLPILAAVVLSAGMVVQTLAGPASVGSGFVAMLTVIYSIGAYATGWTSMAGLLLVLVGVHIYPVVVPERANLADELGNLTIFVGAWLLGRMIRRREIRADRAHRRAVAAETNRGEHLRKALGDERARIASELHDLVAHGVSVMVLQAGAGRQALDNDPAQTRDALLAIENTGRQALDEMHRMVGLLRQGHDDTLAVEPPATLARVDDLLEPFRSAGLAAEVHRSGNPQTLAPGLELNAYRIVQEALTNTLKHSNASRVDVLLDYRPDYLHVVIVDDGPPSAGRSHPHALPGAGHGTISMRERVTMFGGELDIGPEIGGGWRVTARLPIEPP